MVKIYYTIKYKSRALLYSKPVVTYYYYYVKHAMVALNKIIH